VHRRRHLLALASAVAASLTGCSADAGDGPARVADPPPSLLVLGDSYAAGVGADTALTSFAWQLGRDLGLPTTVDGVGGTGFVNPGPGPGPGQQTYLDRLEAVPAEDLDVDLVVVEGGFNDRQYPAAEIESAADAFLAELATRAPGATVVVVGAAAPVPDDPAASAAVNDALSRAARADDVMFLDPTAERWFTDDVVSRYVSDDHVHPTQDGHDYLARRIADAVSPLLE
jgi:lysophospholipase L1-like esterase